MMTLRLLAVAPALSAYLLASAPRGSHHHGRMSLVDGESVAALPPGLDKEVLRSPLPSAQPCKTGDIALVHFTVSKADGTLLHDSRAEEGEPLEFSVGVQPSEVVSRAAGSPPALRATPSSSLHHPRTAHPRAAHRNGTAPRAAPTHRPTHAPRAPPAVRRSAGTLRCPACASGSWRGYAAPRSSPTGRRARWLG